MTATLRRTPVIWILYFFLCIFSIFLDGLGSVIPFLRSEMSLSYGWSSLHFSAFAVGILLAGLAGNWLVVRAGRRRAFELGLLGLAAGGAILVLGSNPAVTVGGVLVMGSLGSLLLVLIPVGLADALPEFRSVTIMEANSAASLAGALMPVAVGLCVQAGLSWRTAIGGAIALALLLLLAFRGIALPDPAPAPAAEAGGGGAANGRLPGRYWLYWVVMLLVVSAEFCFVYWSATFLEAVVGLPRAQAVLGSSVFLAAMVLGRLASSYLARGMDGALLLMGSLVVCLLGFGLHFFGPGPWAALLGLFVAGLGVASLSPMSLSLAIGEAPGQNVLASARFSLASGFAILLLPFALGALADAAGIRLAYGLIAVLPAAALLLVAVGRRR